MTREEAITKLHWLKAELIKGTDLNEPIDMAIEALQVDTIEFDFNKHQPRVRNKVYDEHDFVKVVRCKDCKYRDPEDERCDHGAVNFLFQRTDKDYCSYGERRGEVM